MAGDISLIYKGATIEAIPKAIPASDSSNCNLTNSLVPEITAVSNPKRNHAMAAVRAKNKILLFIVYIQVLPKTV
mgnify:CR=1 FL=1